MAKIKSSEVNDSMQVAEKKQFSHPAYQPYSAEKAQLNFTSEALLKQNIEVKDLNTYILKLMQEIQKLTNYHCNTNNTKATDNFWENLVDIAKNSHQENSLHQFLGQSFDEGATFAYTRGAGYDKSRFPTVKGKTILKRLKFGPSFLQRVANWFHPDDSLPVERVVNQNWTEETKKLADKK